MAIEWRTIEGGAIDGGDYIITSDGDRLWTAKWQGVEIHTGVLEKCIVACKRHLRRVRVAERRASLRRQIHQAEKRTGGNWRTISRVNRLREQLDKSERTWGYEV